MVYSYRSEELKVGMEVWGCAYSLTKDCTGVGLRCEPVKGVLLNIRKQSKPGEGYLGVPYYFVPYRKGEGLLISKKVFIGSRSYADTYEECVKLYNGLIDKVAGDLIRRAREVLMDRTEQNSVYVDILKEVNIG